MIDNRAMVTDSQRSEVTMPMNINLTPQLEELVRAKVSSGLYNSASEVVREALRLMEREDQVRAAALGQLRQDIQAGLASGDAGELDIADIKRRGRERLAAKQR
jgi:antitoxin ParD1/3/4